MFPGFLSGFLNARIVSETGSGIGRSGGLSTESKSLSDRSTHSAPSPAATHRTFWKVTRAGRLQWFWDSCSWAIALFMAAVLRYEFQVRSIHILSVFLMVVAFAVIQFICGMAGWLYQGRYPVGSIEEFRALGWVSLCEVMITGVICVFVGTSLSVPRGLVFLAAAPAVCLMLAIRYERRVASERPQQGQTRDRRRTLILGAGNLGQIMVQRIMMDDRSPYLPVGLLDDDESKVNFSIRSVKVLGKLKDLPQVADYTHASVLLVAIADAGPKLMARVMAIASPLGIDVKVVPTLDKSLGDYARIGQIRDIAIEDLIERPPVTLDIEKIASYLSGKRVLVTGAGGSIGQELCVQIHKYGPSSLVMVDHDETHLQDTEFDLWGTGLLMNPEIVLCDIRDKESLQKIFNQWKPEVVFHAAALKHVPMLQRYPHEAWETNVLGTLNVLECARSVGARKFVNISTDKAANPTTILGYSKRLAERLTSWMGQQTGQDYCSVRFGNVLGSRGSMIPLFQKMIDKGLPITVTHEDATRYFMTIPEACQLVVQAGAIGSRGDTMILDMGSPVRIMDIVNRLIEISGKDVKVQITGIREGEKIHEMLVTPQELDDMSSPANRTVRASVPPFSPENLDYDAWLAMTIRTQSENTWEPEEMEDAIQEVREKVQQLELETANAI